MISKNSKVTIEIDPKHEAVVRQALAMAEDMEQLALTAPEGAVFHACEEAVLEKGRRLQTRMLGAAVARRVEDAEKKGRRSAPASADVSGRTKAPSRGV